MKHLNREELKNMFQLGKDLRFVGATLAAFYGGYFISTATSGYLFGKKIEEKKKLDIRNQYHSNFDGQKEEDTKINEKVS